MIKAEVVRLDNKNDEVNSTMQYPPILYLTSSRRAAASSSSNDSTICFNRDFACANTKQEVKEL